LGYRQLGQLNPRLVYVAISTYGQFGPRAAAPIPDHDVTNQALSGVAHITGEPEGPDGPQPPPGPTRQGSWARWDIRGGRGGGAVRRAGRAHLAGRLGPGPALRRLPGRGRDAHDRLRRPLVSLAPTGVGADRRLQHLGVPVHAREDAGRLLVHRRVFGREL